ncbi:hypothetical protein [Serratia oryzae]|uniref:Uncharacterized protein n=1 Tax=Serratia oryzae TaxID=2034155 RepID=A0A1S8CK43_9GAMM|nr:hypothetical protein [Serratia oryzae]OMQ23016.1 hypothetical protein BMI79_11325 [Serratia oryzae]
MTLINKKKFILRWSLIGVVSLGYFLGLAVASLSFSAFYENQSMQLSGPIPLNEYFQAIDSVVKATDNVLKAAIFGFLICVSLILIIFKKVR